MLSGVPGRLARPGVATMRPVSAELGKCQPVSRPSPAFIPTPPPPLKDNTAELSTTKSEYGVFEGFGHTHWLVHIRESPPSADAVLFFFSLQSTHLPHPHSTVVLTLTFSSRRKPVRAWYVLNVGKLN